MRRSGQIALLTAVALWPALAGASTDEAWQELRDRLTAECTALAGTAAPEAEITVLPNEIGSEGHAVALVVTRPEGAGAMPELAVCLLDKRSGAVELTAAFQDLPDLSELGADPAP